MDHWFALDRVLALGVDPHRESLDVIAIRFPEEIMLDETFDNCRTGHRALWSQANELAAKHELSLVIGLEDGSNYGYSLGRYLTIQGCAVKEVNPRMTNRQRAFFLQPFLSDRPTALPRFLVGYAWLRAQDELRKRRAGRG